MTSEYTNQYFHSFYLGMAVNVVSLVWWVAGGGFVALGLSALNVVFSLFVYPLLLTWCYYHLRGWPPEFGPHQ